MGLHSSLLRFNLLISSQTQPTQPSQEDGQDLRQRQDSCFRYGQVLERSPLIDIGPFFPNNFHFHPFTKFIYNSSNSTPISKNGRQRTYGDVSGTTDFTPNLLWMPTLLLITTQRGLKQIEPSFKS